MKVLIAAIACHPTAGSEAYVGWQAVSALRRDHELCVLTSLWCREGIEKGVNEQEGWEKVRFLYVDQERGRVRNHPNRLIARLQSWTHYRRWCSDAKKTARMLIKQERFDVAHHVTYATWRMGSPLAALGIPWIWGPIGGGETFPSAMLPVLSPIAMLFEIIRGGSTMIARRISSVRRAASSAALVLPNNPETERLVAGLGVPKDRIMRLCQSFLPKKRLERFRCREPITPRECGELRCVAGGNLEGRKGVAIALRALTRLDDEGIPFRYTYLGRGPELEHLKALAIRLGIGDRVSFVDSLSGDEYVSALQSSHVYLLPSLREGVPVTQMEAMAAGCIPVVADCGGAGPMAFSAGSKPVKISTPVIMAEEIAGMLRMLWETPDEWSKLSEMAQIGITKDYSAENYRTMINRYYGMVTLKS